MSTSFKEINSKSLINLTSDILISYPFSLPLQICIFSTCAKIHIVLGNIYSWPLRSSLPHPPPGFSRRLSTRIVVLKQHSHPHHQAIRVFMLT